MTKPPRTGISEQKLFAQIDRLHELFRRLEAATAKQRQILNNSRPERDTDPG